MSRSVFVGVLMLAFAACDAGGGSVIGTGSAAGGNSGATGGGDAGGFNPSGTGGGDMCTGMCSPDFHTIINCDGTTSTCTGDQGCDPDTLTCRNACDVAVSSKLAVGCEYYATFMDQILTNPCFAAFVANTWDTPAHIEVSYQGTALPVANFTRIPQGSGAAIQYLPYDAAAGLPPGEVAIAFLAGGQGGVTCPIPSAVPAGAQISQSGIADAFQITTDVPVVAYQINPYGGGSAQTTAASLLLSSSVWDTNYVAVNITPFDIANPSLNIVASQDNTTVEMVPVAAVAGGNGIPAGPANQVMSFTLDAGQHAQISQQASLTGSIIQSDKPVGFMAGQNCMRAPLGVAYCDHGEQMIPPVKALGSEYVGVMYRPRVPAETETIWKLVGAVDGTQLTYEPDVGGPATLSQGELVEFNTGTPFVVRSQDTDHPFIMMTYMTSNNFVQDGYGDPDLVVSVPPAQYLSRYVFFADPTYPESNLVIIRRRHPDGNFRPVVLDCAGELTGWQAIGDFEWTRVDLMTGDFNPVGGCSTGAHEITSEATFGLWVWGWGTPETSSQTRDVSYGYPGGMNVLPINDVVIPSIPD